MTLAEIQEAAIKALPRYSAQIKSLIGRKDYNGLFDLLRKSDKSNETAEIRRALVLEYMDEDE